MNSENEKSKKHRKSSSQSSSSRSRSRSRDRERERDRKKSKKEKKRKRSRSKEKIKRRRSKSNKKSKRTKDRKRSKSRSAESEDKFKFQHSIPPMDPQMMSQFMYYPQVMAPRDARMVRPPIFYPPYADPYRPVRHPMPPVIPQPKILETPQTLEQPPDKIVKDQNFLNSDEKLFESIVNNEVHIRTLFEDTQISETYAGSTLYKTLKKLLHDPNTTIFESDKSLKQNENNVLCIKPNELVQLEIENFLNKNSYSKLSINMGDLSSIKEELNRLRNRVEAEKKNNI